MDSTYYITTTIPYVNALPHLGHSYELVATDALARYRRLCGRDVWFLTGLDENSQNIEKKARELGKETKEYVDEMAAGFRNTWEKLDISFDDMLRTTEPRHWRASQELFQRAYDNGDIYLGEHNGYYCNSCEAKYDEEDLVDGTDCPVHHKKCEWLAEKNYFFALSKYQDRLIQLFRDRPDWVYPASRRNEVLAFIERGLNDFSVTRADKQWGVPCPIDESHVMYVWFDALINYLTGVGFPDHQQMYEKYWPCDVHVMGKDMWRFHCVYWPAMLMSAGLPLPRRAAVHGFLNLKGEKMSKTRGIYVDPVAAVDAYGSDAIRYFLLRDMPFDQDGDFTWEAFAARYNADLANDLGNLLNRTLRLVNAHFNGAAPPAGEPKESEQALAQFASERLEGLHALMGRYQLHLALDEAMSLIRETNRYLSERKPWDLAKRGDLGGAGTVLYHAMEALRWTGAMLSPFIPSAVEKMRSQLGVSAESFDGLVWGGLEAGKPIGEASPLFPRIDMKAEAEAKTSSQPKESKPKMKAQEKEIGVVSFDDFRKIDLRVARVVEAERAPKADKLLKLTTQVGSETRVIVAGIAEHYAPEELIGKRIVIVANLAPRTIFGIESQGMLLAGKDGEALVIAEFEREIADGAEVS
ncbi:MAG: methionine--tRNA ligase [Candidatus Poribacteria bacterium]|nr:methionine--tRNA ligase [Candidatus Poribacteria bacterium]